MCSDNTPHFSVHTRQLNFSLQELQNLVDANDIITDPDYQRRYVYDTKHASKLIESILIGISIPIIYLAEEDEGIYSVIDGQQRITSFVKYLKNEFALVGLTTLSNLKSVLSVSSLSILFSYSVLEFLNPFVQFGCNTVC